MDKTKKIFFILAITTGMFLFIFGSFLANRTDKNSEISTGIVGNTVYEFNSIRAFNGDGYSILIKELTSDAEELLANGSLDYVLEVDSEYESALSWTNTPSSPKYDEVVKFITDTEYIAEARDSELPSYSNKILDLLSSEGNYYALIASEQIIEDGGRPLNIDMYIIDTTSNYLYLINQDT